jgi:hypothetical protein
MTNRCYDAKERFLMTNWWGVTNKSSQRIIAQLDPLTDCV